MNTYLAIAISIVALPIAIAIYSVIESIPTFIYNKVSDYRYLKSLNDEVDETLE
jgi:hypothetical protein